MRRIAIIGAGSIVFCKTLMLDIMATKDLEDTEFVLMAPSTGKTSQVKAFADRVIKENHLKSKVTITTDRRVALRGANYVITSFQVGGVSAFELDYKIPMKYGVDQCIGDTLGPGGVFRALRSIPVILEVAKDMEELCPNATLLNYVNPMAMICWALGETNVKYVGLCHGVQTTLDLIAGYTGVSKQEIDYISAGINHMGWFTELSHKGVDLYPLLREKFEQPEFYVNEKVRGEVFRHFGYFMTESTGHLSEYVPWFRKNQKALDEYCDEPSFGGETGAYYTWCTYVADKYKEQDILSEESAALPPRSVEYCAYIIEALETGRTFKFSGNIRNDGMISNLPAECCAEGAVFADRTGLHRTIIGEIPPQCAALNLTNINVQRLAVLAAKSGDPETVVHALALDPLTSSVLTLREIREMVTEMLQAEQEWLPQFGGRLPRPTPEIPIPMDLKRAEVPIDPALAVFSRFGELAK
ncbi:alpha-glucosidase/alpha-galactosidase [Paenibacillus baekrokdamisoli]|uniref:Alpha-glucosidase/alpha-galactosidase n=1 Tax=Paenibacillus baekrokdamisoli TaxID=1712516 RepID=A0A3G9IQK1_9BACL|nr:alpha-galactosidase [Paenibacillus baekrokdamisoli]MBB3072505.1 alpha-galactosidase [Paenibacillus baekrokdamisoli]BBH20562.1 alpha-glucosidase/alpha-galactosidase [Paenibacillus baekrokdamisoli]